MINTKFSPWPSFTEKEAKEVKKTLLSNKVNYWTGNKCREFEKKFASFTECDYAVAVSNGTVALDLALKALNITEGDEVIVTSRTFIASVSSIVLSGASPVFADVDCETQNITASTILSVLTSKTKAILCVHLAGWPCEMDEIMMLAKQYELYVIEDCAQAHGAKYKGKPVGSIGHVGAWSFCQDKIMTTGGEGGMVTTNDKLLWERIWSYKDHGKNWNSVYTKKHPLGFRWLHDSFGTNWRMMEVQATIGLIQLEYIKKWSKHRIDNANKIWNVANECNALRVPEIPPYIEHAAYKCYVFVKESCLKEGWNRDAIIKAIESKEVPCYSGSCSEVYLEQAFDGTSFRPKKPCSVARNLGNTSLMFLVHPTLTKDEIDKTCRVIKDVMNSATLNSIN